MSDDIVIQLKDLASTMKRGEGRSTVYGAVSEIEYLRAEVDKWKKLAEEQNTHSWRNLVQKRYGIEDMYGR